MKSLPDLERNLVGVAGEYFVAAELSLRGCLASITLRNSRGIDIIASNADASKSVSVQVKTSNDERPAWILTRKSETFFSSNHFYVFVSLRPSGQRPDFYIVPSEVVAREAKSSHAEWLAGKKVDGSARKDSEIRKFADYQGKYRECWGLLGL